MSKKKKRKIKALKEEISFLKSLVEAQRVGALLEARERFALEDSRK